MELKKRLAAAAALLAGLGAMALHGMAAGESRMADAEEIYIEDYQSLVRRELEEGQEEMEQLADELEAMTADADGDWSIHVEDLDTGHAADIGGESAYAASLIKLYVMESTYAHMEEILEDDSARSGSAAKSREKVDSLLDRMITVSDNEAYNELVRLHSRKRSFREGCEKVSAYIREQGYDDTGIYHTLSPSETKREATDDRKNHTSPKDCARLLERIYDGTCVSQEASQQMLDLLLAQQIDTKIPAGLPEEAEAANKTGETDEAQHDAAIVFGAETDYILCVMSEDLSDTEEAQERIREISGCVYEALNT